MSNTTPGILLSSKVYDTLKPIVGIVLPGLGTLYFALAAIWNLPYAEQVVGTIAALTTFLGLLLGLSSRTYNKSDTKFDGSLDISEEDSRIIHQLEITSTPEQIKDQKSVTFKINKISPDQPLDSPPRS